MICCYRGPTVGVNRRLGWNPRIGRMIPDPAYKKFKEALSWAMKAHYEKLTGNVSVRITATVHPSRDVDSLIKPVLDALEDSGVVDNDRQVVSISVHKEAKKRGEEDSLVICARELVR